MVMMMPSSCFSQRPSGPLREKREEKMREEHAAAARDRDSFSK